MDLTTEQLSILAAGPGSSNLCIEALAGTGKTFMLSKLAPTLKAPTILALAFNVKAKDELAAKLPSKVIVKTLNGLGHGAWSQYVRRPLSVDSKKTWNLSQALQREMNIRFSKEENSDISQLVSTAKSQGWVPSGTPWPHSPLWPDTPEDTSDLFDLADVEERDDYRTFLRALMLKSIDSVYRNGLLDFNDQLYMPVCFRAPFTKYHTTIVDEFQDLSALNHKMIEKSTSSRFIIVGDPNQAIYAFRGALTSSFETFMDSKTFERFPLTTTFRCAKAIVRRQQDFVPNYNAAEGAPEGEVKTFETWTKASIPPGTTIICRNNAPLISMAFALLRQGVPAQVLGTDIGKALESSLNKATKGLGASAPTIEVTDRIEGFFRRETAKAKTDRRRHSLADRRECLLALASNCPNLTAMRSACSSLFSNPDATILLSSGHKSKGLEWDTVIHLDPHLIPSKYARSPEALRQEDNLKYVIETRARTTLILAYSEDFK